MNELETTQSNEIIPNQTEIRSIEETVKSAERYLESLGKIRLLAIKMTNNLDWSSQGDKPYLEKSGCDKIAAAFGVKIFGVTSKMTKYSDDKGDYYICETIGGGKWNNHEQEEKGTCSTRDDFFGKKGGNYKPLSEVDLTDIMKKSFTNFANRLIKKLLGLSFSWEEIALLSGNTITKNTVSKVEFGQGSKGGNTDSPETKKLRDECRAWLLKLNDFEEKHAVAMLIKMTEFPSKDIGADGKPVMVPGKDNVLKLSEKQVQILHGKLKKGIEALNQPEAAATEAPAK